MAEKGVQGNEAAPALVAFAFVNDRPTCLYSAQQDAVSVPRGGTGSVSWSLISVRWDTGVPRSRKCHPSREGPVPPVRSFSPPQGSTARTVGYLPGPCRRPPRIARGTTSAISED